MFHLEPSPRSIEEKKNEGQVSQIKSCHRLPKNILSQSIVLFVKKLN
jgi:hypothetical protein